MRLCQSCLVWHWKRMCTHMKKVIDEFRTFNAKDSAENYLLPETEQWKGILADVIVYYYNSQEVPND